ncbi:MAG: DnaJ domain-containing protein [Myxococcaceae bacterium]|nr:DnaJ domain-containing protein [Myxococcaceae bacterium]MCI0673408.1 DnaJ domain-containing protein [Myxococcaceae bacterium]
MPTGLAERGELGPVSALRLYYLAASSQATGRLLLELADRQLELHFRKGQPDYVDSSHPDDAVGACLMRGRLLTPDQLADAEAAKSGFGGELLGALFGLGLVPPPQAFVLLTQRAHELIARAVLAESGRYRFGPSDLPASKALPLGDRWGLLSALVRRLPGPELRRRLQSVLALPVMKSGGRVDVSELRLTPQEARTLGRIDGVRSLEQLMQETPQEADNLLRLAYLLRELEALSFVPAQRPVVKTTAVPPTSPVNTQRPAPTARTVAAPNTAASPGARPPPVLSPAQPGAPTRPTPGPASSPAQPTRGGAQAHKPLTPSLSQGERGQRTQGQGSDVARGQGSGAAPGPDVAPDLPSLRTLLDALKGQNHFQRLGVPENADTSAVKAAYFRLARVHHPDTVPPGAPQEMAKLKADIFAAIGEAYRALGDDALRADYILELATGGGEVDVANILKAEDLFNRACAMVKARRFAEAAKLLDDAIALNPDEGEFYAWRGYSRFFTLDDKISAKAQALRELQEALKRNERCVPAHYFTGQVIKLSGDAAGALKHFKRTLELKPDHIDAAREVRLMGGKK